MRRKEIEDILKNLSDDIFVGGSKGKELIIDLLVDKKTIYCCELSREEYLNLCDKKHKTMYDTDIMSKFHRKEIEESKTNDN